MRAVFVGALLVGVAATARTAAALSICAAADLVAQEPSCPASGACTITKQYTVTDGCTLDFSGRDVTLAPSAVLTVGSGTMTILANDLVLAAAPSSSAYINGRGTGQSSPTDQGGVVSINATGNVVVQKNGDARARIEVSGTGDAGIIGITAGGTVTIAGRLRANQELHASMAGGGGIFIESAHDIVSLAGSQILAGGGSLSENNGGTIQMDADGRIDLGAPLDVSGSYGGEVDLDGGGDVIVRGILANGAASDGMGGYVSIVAGQNVRILDSPIHIDGSDDQSEGGCGGGAAIESVDGDLIIAVSISADGYGLVGAGGDMSINSGRALSLSPGAMVSVHGYGDIGGGDGAGELNVRSVTTMTLAGKIDGSSQYGGAQVGIEAGGDMTITGAVTVTGLFAAEAYGGELFIGAGHEGSGDLVISNTIDVSSGVCDLGGCPSAGSIEIYACDITFTRTGKLIGNSPEQGGDTTIGARGHLQFDGSIDMRHIGSRRQAVDGSVDLMYLNDPPPVFRPNSILPAPILEPKPPCDSGEPDCIEPCSSCGDGDTLPECTPTIVPTPTPSPTPTEPGEPAATVTPSVSSTPPPVVCAGDCGGDGEVSIDELVLLVDIALGNSDVAECTAGDSDGDGEIAIDEVINAVSKLLEGCEMTITKISRLLTQPVDRAPG